MIFQGVLTAVIHVMDREPVQQSQIQQCQKMCNTMEKSVSGSYKVSSVKFIETKWGRNFISEEKLLFAKSYWGAWIIEGKFWQIFSELSFHPNIFDFQSTLLKTIESMCAPKDSYAACVYHTVKFDVNGDFWFFSHLISKSHEFRCNSQVKNCNFMNMDKINSEIQ